MPLTLVPLVDELYKQYRLPRSVAAEEDLLYFVAHTTRMAVIQRLSIDLSDRGTRACEYVGLGQTSAHRLWWRAFNYS